MDSTSPIAARIAGQTSADSAVSCKPIFAMGLLTLVENLFVGRRWNFGENLSTGDHRRYREYHYRSAGGYGHAS
ncbi:hypothetical protein [Halorussus ruber]|uniref:hypothetical protein n=1 Tax=Halorussus ruber TaxID=1126238 RepID=UPI001091BD12|nr:hypothetical protein [Halorussus ruber]